MKKLIPRNRLYLCLLVALTIPACTNYTSIRQHKDFAQLFPKYNSVTIIPTEIFITRQTKNGQEYTMPDPARINNITQIAESVLVTKGYNVASVVFEEDTKSADEFNNAYKKSINNLYGDKQKSKKEAAFLTNENIGKIAAKIAGESRADLLLVLGYSGTELSQEVVTKSLARDVALASLGMENQTHVKNGSAFISLIERQNGKILWTNMGSDFENYGKSVARVITKNNVMETAFAKALKEIPAKN